MNERFDPAKLVDNRAGFSVMAHLLQHNGSSSAGATPEELVQDLTRKGIPESAAWDAVDCVIATSEWELEVVSPKDDPADSEHLIFPHQWPFN